MPGPGGEGVWWLAPCACTFPVRAMPSACLRPASVPRGTCAGPSASPPPTGPPLALPPIQAALSTHPPARPSLTSSAPPATHTVRRGTALRVFASAGVSGQLGRFTRPFLDYTAASARIDVGLTSPHVVGVVPDPSTLAADSAHRPDKHRAFALEGRGSWHALSLSLAQQVVGPVSTAAPCCHAARSHCILHKPAGGPEAKRRVVWCGVVWCGVVWCGWCCCRDCCCGVVGVVVATAAVGGRRLLGGVQRPACPEDYPPLAISAAWSARRLDISLLQV